MLKPLVIIVAGMPRSGGTWQFNAVRLILDRKYPTFFSGWHEDYNPETKEPVHLVKAHHPLQIYFDYSLVLTTKRDLLECIESLNRMGWLKEDNFIIQVLRQMHAYNYWHDRTALEIDYLMIKNNPEKAILDMSQVLEIEITFSDAKEISNEVTKLEPPKHDDTKPQSYDKLTLLHPRHIAESYPPTLTDEQKEFFYDQFSYWK
jgi:hypothetical protein